MKARVGPLLAATARWLGYGSAAFLVVMMLITVADVTLRAAFNRPITGAYDLVQFFLVGVVFLNLPAVFLAEENIAVDLVDHLGRPSTVGCLRILGGALGLAFLAVLAWQAIEPAGDAVRFGETAADLSMSLGWHWGLILLGLFATLPTAGYALREQLKRHRTRSPE